MKPTLFATCAFLLLATSAFAGDGSDNDHGPNQSIATEMGYRTMDNGSVVYEEVEPSAGPKAPLQPIEDIAPAAGTDDSAPANGSTNPNAAPVFHYDPLTQTYHRVTVDKQGNTRQDVINTAK